MPILKSLVYNITGIELDDLLLLVRSQTLLSQMDRFDELIYKGKKVKVKFLIIIIIAFLTLAQGIGH